MGLSCLSSRIHLSQIVITKKNERKKKEVACTGKNHICHISFRYDRRGDTRNAEEAATSYLIRSYHGAHYWIQFVIRPGFRSGPVHVACLSLCRKHGLTAVAGGRQRPPPAARPPLASQQGSVARHARFGESILLRVFARETLRSQSAVLTRQCVSTRCLDWVSRYRQTGPDRGQPSSAPGPGTDRLELPNSFPPRAGPTCLPAPTDHGEEFLETAPGRQAGRHK